MGTRALHGVLLAALLATTALLVSAQPGGAQGAGSVVGDVRLSGAAPPAKLVRVVRDTEVCGSEKKVVDVALGAGNGLANAVVTVVDVKVARPAGKATLEEKGCEFRPEMLVVAPGEVDIVNSEGVFHNPHTLSTANPPVNRPQPRSKKVLTEKLDRPEVVKIQCDVHGWMHGWIVVTENAAAVTDEKGSFKIDGVPAGSTRWRVWHPVLGRQSREVEVRPGQEARVSFQLAARK